DRAPRSLVGHAYRGEYEISHAEGRELVPEGVPRAAVRNLGELRGECFKYFELAHRPAHTTVADGVACVRFADQRQRDGGADSDPPLVRRPRHDDRPTT